MIPFPQPRPGLLDPVQDAAKPGQLVKEGGVLAEGVNRRQENFPCIRRPSKPVKGGGVVEPPGTAPGIELDHRHQTQVPAPESIRLVLQVEGLRFCAEHPVGGVAAGEDIGEQIHDLVLGQQA
jgi:hypothetical protein